MDANKLIRIISKDLEELKTLTSEITDTENDSALLIDLALSRAKLLCQEIELLKEITSKTITRIDEPEDEIDEEEKEITENTISEPELEIINFEVPESEENVEMAKEEEEDEEDEEKEIEEDIVYNSEEEEEELIGEDFITPEDLELEVEDKRNVDESEEEEDVDDDDSDEDFEEEEEIEDEDDEDEIEDEEKFEGEEEEEEEDKVVTEVDEPEDDFQPNSSLEVNELNPTQHAGIREIQIEDLDEEESDSIQFTPVSKPVERPIMREIPKPEALIEEEKPEDDNSQKERSLNEVISENKSAETTLGYSPISSLKASIGLNDRFLFIREIFSNNTDKYNMVIDHLDKLETIQQAVDYLKSNLTLTKNETSMKFVDLLKRRFTK